MLYRKSQLYAVNSWKPLIFRRKTQKSIENPRFDTTGQIISKVRKKLRNL